MLRTKTPKKLMIITVLFIFLFALFTGILWFGSKYSKNYNYNNWNYQNPSDYNRTNQSPLTGSNGYNKLPFKL